MVKCYIYKIIDKTNNNIYIGSTASKFGCKHRYSQHKNDLQRYMDGSLNYRSYMDIIINNNYEYEIIEECDFTDYDEQLNKECIYLNIYKSLYSDKLVNKCLMTKRFDDINCNLGGIL